MYHCWVSQTQEILLQEEMTQKNDKKSRKNRKTMAAEESKSKWADSTSESSDSEWQFSDNDDKGVQCLMADTDPDTAVDEVFDFDF